VTHKAMSTLAVVAALAAPARAATPETISLHKGWTIQAAAKVQADGKAISQAGFTTTGWQPTDVPSTVLGALVRGGVYKDPFFARNLAGISAEPFKGPWWYRTEFTITGPAASTRLLLDGLNYRADVWLNGKKIADKANLYGVWRLFDLDATAAVREGTNVLAALVYPPAPGDWAMGFVDWNPLPADRNMGLYRPVEVRRSGAVSLEDPYVQSEVDLRTLKEASLTVSVRLVNHGDRAASGRLTGAIGKIRFQAPYSLGPRESKVVRFSPAEVPALRVREPRLWWPVNLGKPELYTLELGAALDGAGRPSDSRSVTFGIRQVGDYVNDQGHRGYTVNGQRVLIRGGGWVDDLFLREDERNLDAQLEYVRHMNLNAIRLEGFWGASQRLYDLADRKGILVMTGFSCQWEWDHYLGKAQDDQTYGAAKSPQDAELLTGYLRDQVRWLRNHPSVLVWLVGSDKLPWPHVEKRYREVLHELDPGRPYLASAKGWTSEVSGPTAVKMLGPYNYVTPNYWYEDRQHGGAYGFNTETGPGPQVPTLASLRKMLPPDKLWPINEAWSFHCAEHEYSDLSLFLNAFNHRYGQARSVEEFAYKAQAASYEAMRAMFEAFGAHKPRTTGVIQWMLNGAWPKLYWQLYDYFLMPTGAFYGARKGSQPQTLVYDYADRGVYLVNDTLGAVRGAAQVTVLDLAGKTVVSRQAAASVGANAATRLLELPPLDTGSPVYFLSLRLRGPQGQAVADNFYWLSSKPDVLDPAHNTEPYMPNKSFADFTALADLPPAKVKLTSAFQRGGGQVTLTNSSDKLAFFLELQLNRGDSKEPVAPVFWDDNYLSLLPGESRTVTVRFADADLRGAQPTVALTGWNLDRGP
jgi:exo-1,4-beta-D-glucosaminidase